MNKLNKIAALQIYKLAHAYPRCGKGWPATDAEDAAQAAIDAAGVDPLTGLTAAQDAAAEAALMDAAERLARRNEADAVSRAAVVAAAAARAGDDVAAFLRTVGSATDAEVMSLGITERRLGALSAGRKITKNRRGQWVAL